MQPEQPILMMGSYWFCNKWDCEKSSGASDANFVSYHIYKLLISSIDVHWEIHCFNSDYKVFAGLISMQFQLLGSEIRLLQWRVWSRFP